MLSPLDPLIPQLSFDLIMGDDSAGFDVEKTLLDTVEDVEVIQNILEAALVREAIEEVSDFSLGLGQVGFSIPVLRSVPR